MGRQQEEESHNTWNALLEALTMPGTSPPIQQSLQDLGRMQDGSAVPLRFEQLVFVHGMVSRGATAETPKLSGACLRLHPCRHGKQGSDCMSMEW